MSEEELIPDYNPGIEVLRHARRLKYNHKDITLDQAIDLVKISQQQEVLRAFKQQTEEIRRWRLNLVNTGILDKDGLPLLF